jgi:hypothetical protein
MFNTQKCISHLCHVKPFAKQADLESTTKVHQISQFNLAFCPTKRGKALEASLEAVVRPKPWEDKPSKMWLGSQIIVQTQFGSEI